MEGSCNNSHNASASVHDSWVSIEPCWQCGRLSSAEPNQFVIIYIRPIRTFAASLLYVSSRRTTTKKLARFDERTNELRIASHTTLNDVDQFATWLKRMAHQLPRDVQPEVVGDIWWPISGPVVAYAHVFLREPLLCDWREDCPRCSSVQQPYEYPFQRLRKGKKREGTRFIPGDVTRSNDGNNNNNDDDNNNTEHSDSILLKIKPSPTPLWLWWRWRRHVDDVTSMGCMDTIWARRMSDESRRAINLCRLFVGCQASAAGSWSWAPAEMGERGVVMA